MTYKVIGEAEAVKVKTLGHFGEPFGLNQVVEGEGRKHGPIPVDVSLD